MVCFVAAHLFWDLFPERCSQDVASSHFGMAGASFGAILNLYCTAEVIQPIKNGLKLTK